MGTRGHWRARVTGDEDRGGRPGAEGTAEKLGQGPALPHSLPTRAPCHLGRPVSPLQGAKSERAHAGSPGASLSDTVAQNSWSLSFHPRNSPAGVRALLVSLVTPSAHYKPSQGSGSLPFVDGPVHGSFSLCLCRGGWTEGYDIQGSEWLCSG